MLRRYSHAEIALLLGILHLGDFQKVWKQSEVGYDVRCEWVDAEAKLQIRSS